jgi:VWFA-related protein
MPGVRYNTAFVSRHFSYGRFAVIAIWLGLSAIPAWPQRALGSTPFCPQERVSTQPAILRSEVDLQTVNVQVKDKQGNNVPELVAKDFAVRENGKPEKISFFDAGSGPVTVAVLVDSASSLVRSGRLGSAEEVAARFMRIARPGDEIWAMDFTDSMGPFLQITQKQLSSSGPLTVPGAGGNGSAVYDAIATAICHLRSSTNPREAIIAITDGLDEHSRLSLNQLIDAVRSQRAQLFLIGLPSRPGYRSSDRTEPKVTLVSGHDVDNPGAVFDRLTKEADAETFIPKSENGLQDALKTVSNLLDSEYTLAYYSSKTSRKLRKIEVKVHRRGARILKSRFIVANSDAADLVHYVQGTCTVSPKFYPYPYDSHVTNGRSGTVYRDEFFDKNSGWPQHPDSHYVSGGYELSTMDQRDTETNKSASTTGVMGGAGVGGLWGPATLGEAQKPIMTFRNNVVAAYGPSWDDFRVSATMKAVFEPALPSPIPYQFRHPVHPAAGLVFRMNEDGYYALLIKKKVDLSTGYKQKLAFEVVARTFQGDSFAESVIVPWTTVDRASPEEAQLAVEDVGGQITVLVNGRQVGTAHDDTFDGGYVGFTVSAPAYATFSNLIVEQR